MPRFAILEHDHPSRHWDLLLETGSVCRTWRLASPPADGTLVAAEIIPDHRLLYLDYEGPVGGDRGHVVQWDAGRFVWIAAREDRVSVLLDGRRCTGRLELTRSVAGWQAKLVAAITDPRPHRFRSKHSEGP